MKVIFDKEAIDPEIPGVLLLSHSELAVAMVKTANFIYGEAENLAAFSFEDEDNPEKYTEAFMEALEAFPEGSIIFTDIFGGSPCNQLIITAKRRNLKIHAIAGMSLPLVLAALNNRSFDRGDDLMKSIFEELPDFTVNITEKLGG